MADGRHIENRLWP